MAIVQIRSVHGPFDSPAVAHLAVTVLTRADAMGLLPPKETIERLDMTVFLRLVEGIAQAGIGNGLLADLAASSSPNPRQLSVTLQELNEALDASPTPASEWPQLRSGGSIRKGVIYRFYVDREGNVGQNGRRPSMPASFCPHCRERSVASVLAVLKARNSN